MECPLEFGWVVRLVRPVGPLQPELRPVLIVYHIRADGAIYVHRFDPWGRSWWSWWIGIGILAMGLIDGGLVIIAILAYGLISKELAIMYWWVAVS